jgi:hypothetical protein
MIVKVVAATTFQKTAEAATAASKHGFHPE